MYFRSRHGEYYLAGLLMPTGCNLDSSLPVSVHLTLALRHSYLEGNTVRVGPAGPLMPTSYNLDFSVSLLGPPSLRITVSPSDLTRDTP